MSREQPVRPFGTTGRAASPAQLQQLVGIVQASSWLEGILRALRRVLPEGYVGAGAVRDVVWDRLEGRSDFLGCADVDVAYFDPSDVRPERDHEIERALRHLKPDEPWEVTNQAGVHLWFEQHFGHGVEPLISMEDAVATWPEFAAAVAVRYGPTGAIEVLAPHGLDDLLSMTVRRNPRRVSVETYRRRLHRKRYAERWPSVTVLDVD